MTAASGPVRRAAPRGRSASRSIRSSADVYDAVIVGGGHNGLVAATLLGRAGASVLVLERREQLGGAAVSGSPFDGVGVRLSRYAYLVSLFPRELLRTLGVDVELRRRRVSSYTPVGAAATARDPRTGRTGGDTPTGLTGGGLQTGRTAGDTPTGLTGGGLQTGRTGGDTPTAHKAGLLVERNSAPSEDWRRFYAMVGRVAERVFPTLTRPLLGREQFRSRIDDEAAWEALFEQPLSVVLEETFSSDLVRGVVLTDGTIGTFAPADDPWLRQNRCFLYHLVGNGSGHWDVPVGGMGALTQALERSARAASVELRTGAEVVSVATDGTSAEIACADGRTFAARHVLANVAPRVLARLLGEGGRGAGQAPARSTPGEDASAATPRQALPSSPGSAPTPPAAPAAPTSPTAPRAPAAPTSPTAPRAPAAPTAPAVLTAPSAPTAPTAPAAAIAPTAAPEGSQLKINMLLSRLPRLRDPAVTPEQAFGGTFHVNEGYSQLQRAYEEAAGGQIPSLPPCELYCHSLADPSILSTDLRAAGAHTLTLFGLHMPARLFRDPASHTARKDAAVAATLSSLNDVLAEPIEDCLWRTADGAACLEALTPVELEAELGMPGGHIFHRDLAWPFAESDQEIGTWGVETAYPNVWLCGAGARRGGGVSGIPGHNAAQAVLAAWSSR